MRKPWKLAGLVLVIVFGAYFVVNATKSSYQIAKHCVQPENSVSGLCKQAMRP